MKQLKWVLITVLLGIGALAMVSCESDDETDATTDTEAMAETSGDAMATSSRLDTVKERGSVICASRNDVPGYGSLDADGNNVGFDIDLCRAVAAAVLGDPNAIEIRLITAAERGPTVQSGEVDMLVRTVTWTTSRDAQWGNYAQTMFYDGQGFMVRNDLGISSALELRDASVCVTQGTTTELNLQDFSNQNSLNITPLTFEDTDAVVAAYEAGQCDAFTNDRSQLAALGTALQNRADHTILPETISEEPLGPVVPHGDDEWFDIVKTVMGILIYAEAYGVGQANVPSAATGDTKVDRLFGLGRRVRPGEPGPEQHRGAGRHPGRGQLRRNLRPQPGTGWNQPAARERPKRPLVFRSLHGLPEGRPDLLGAPALTPIQR